MAIFFVVLRLLGTLLTLRLALAVAASTVAQRLFTVEEYERMIETGIICSGERVELWEGRIVAMAAMGGPHVAGIQRSARSLWRVLPSTADVRVQAPVRLLPDAEPEPDLAVVQFREDDYVGGIPDPNRLTC